MYRVIVKRQELAAIVARARSVEAALHSRFLSPSPDLRTVRPGRDSITLGSGAFAIGRHAAYCFAQGILQSKDGARCSKAGRAHSQNWATRSSCWLANKAEQPMQESALLAASGS